MNFVSGFLQDYRGLGRGVWCLAVAETLVYAGMYYIFAGLLLHWEADLGWSKTELVVALSLALASSALAAPLAGRLIDRGHGRILHTGSALVGGLLVGLLVLVETRAQFIALWGVMGLCMAGCFYEPCFAYLTRSRGPQARRAITLVTLVAGFAGTLSFPTANALAEAFGWRAGALAFAGLICFVAVPLFWIGCARPVQAAAAPLGGAKSGDGIGQAMRRPLFWLLAFAFTMIGVNHAALINHLLPLLDERGVPLATAVVAASFVGPMQVAGRILMIIVERWVSMNMIAALTYVAMIIASASLFAAGSFPALLVLFIFFQGAGIGVTSITRPVVIASMLGHGNFGMISGALAVPFTFGAAFAPTLAALVWGLGGYDVVLAMTLGMAALGLGAFLLAARSSRPTV